MASSDGGRPGVDGTLFRTVMRRWASGVTVATVRDGDDVRGITLSSFSSVSLDPPLVLISVDKRAVCHGMIGRSGHFCVHILAEGQTLISDRFAGRRPGEHAEFADCSTGTTPSGAPIIDRCLGYFDCRVTAAVDGGDHTIFVGLVEAGEATDDVAPLVFYAGSYRKIETTA
ncbi:MAG: flavin reductase [Chloroflexota bacterium]|nr:MAG: flavin reductase [Chloroflexota bacterium]